MTDIEKYSSCTLCPRACHADRESGKNGVCHSPATPLVAHSMLHAWEEPCLSGNNGSGTVFFSGCPLGCIYCQNEKISRGGVGRAYSAEDLAALYLSLEEKGAHNVNLVTAAHYAPHIISSVALARKAGLSVPVVYNTSGYESVDTLRALESTVDIYLTDFRYSRFETAREYSFASDYPPVAAAALAEMVKQKPKPDLDEMGLMKSGVIVRILLLPSHLIEAKMILKSVFEAYGDNVYISLMSQYTPVKEFPEHPHLSSCVSASDYRSLVEYAQALGVKNAFIQEGSAASESFIPNFEG